MSELTHLDEKGAANMVGIDQKSPSQRRAVAHGHITVQPTTIDRIRANNIPKGDVFAVARVAGIMAAKETSRLVPLCHPLKITGMSINFDIDDDQGLINVEASVDAFDRTGVEMEALTAVSVASLTLYDMLKAIDPNMMIGGVEVTHKSGGRHDFTRSSSSTFELSQEMIGTEVDYDRPQSAYAGLGRSIKVVGKPMTQVSPANLIPSPSSMTSDEPSEQRTTALSHQPVQGMLDEVISSCEKPLVQLLTPLEPISALNQSSSLSAEQPSQSEESDVSVWEESMLAEAIDHETSVFPPVSEYAQETALKVREASLNYAPLQAFIIKRPVECAYLLGYLSPAFTQRSRAYILESDEGENGSLERIPKIKALLFIYSGLTVPTIWTYGTEQDIESILYAVHNELPRRIYLNVEDHHYHSIRTYYRMKSKREVLRMGLQRELYQPIGDSQGVVTLGHPDTGAIMSLFQRYYPDNLFEPAQLESGLYCGIKDESSLLVSVAGIHLLNPDYRVAAIGNIVTDSSCRGRGYATKCVRHILDRLFDVVDSVALNVNEDNTPAIYCYQKFGFQTTARLIEAQARLR
jgi:cyclic pyranopterin monophosphate synthase